MAKTEPLVLSAIDYVTKQVPDLPDKDVVAVIVKHAVGVVELLQGKIKENALPTEYPGADGPSQSREGLQLLLAMKMGRVFEQAKLEYIDTLLARKLSQSDLNLESIQRPWLVPLGEYPDKVKLLRLIVGLPESVVKGELDGSNNGVASLPGLVAKEGKDEKLEESLVNGLVKMANATSHRLAIELPKPLRGLEATQKEQGKGKGLKQKLPEPIGFLPLSHNNKGD